MYKLKSRNFTSLYFIILGVFLILTSGCNQIDKQRNNKTIIAGKIISYNYLEDDKTFELYFDDVLGSSVVEMHQLNNDGEFYLTIDRPYPQDFSFKYGFHFRLYISPGDSLYLKIDHKVLQAEAFQLNPYHLIKVTGNASKMNNDMLKYQEHIEDSLNTYEQATADFFAIKDSGPIQYKMYVESKVKEQQKGLDTFNAYYNTCPKFKDWANKYIIYKSFNNLMDYRQGHPQFNNMTFDHSIGRYFFEIPIEYFSFLSDKNIDNKDALICSQYYSFMDTYTWYVQADLVSQDSLQKTIALLKNADTIAYYEMQKRQVLRSTSGFTQDIILANLYSWILETTSLSVFEEVSKTSPIQDTVLKKLIKNKYQNLISASENDLSSNSIVTPIFDSIINAYKDKVLYLDFWAPWCAPCMKEMPFSKNIQSEFKDTDVVFVFLAHNCSKESWQETVAEKEIKGVHYLLSNDQYKTLRSKFSLGGIPHYMIVDKKGIIINSNVPSPSDSIALKKKILELLN